MQLVKSTIGLKERKVLPKILMANGGYYEGEWLNGLRDGTGKHVFKKKIANKQYWQEGGYYEGEWKEDRA